MRNSIDNRALESDVREILFQNSEIRLNQIRNIILEFPDYKRKVNVEGAEKGSLSRTLDTYISRILKKLKKDGEVQRRYDDQKGIFLFSYTKSGRKYASFKLIHSKLRNSTKIPPQESLELLLPKIIGLSIATTTTAHTEIADAKTIMTLHDIAPTGKAPVDIAIWLDPANKDKIIDVSNNLRNELFLENMAERFVESCKTAILSADKKLYRWSGWANGPPQISKMIETVRTSLDFDAILMLHFDGKRFIANYDWKSDIIKYEQNDAIETKKALRFIEKVNQSGKIRDLWKDFRILDDLYWLNHELEVFNYSKNTISSDQSALVRTFAEHIMGLMIAGNELHNDPEPPTIEAIERYIQSLLDDGTLKFAYTLTLDEEKAREKKKAIAINVNDETGYWLDPSIELAEVLNRKIMTSKKTPTSK